MRIISGKFRGKNIIAPTSLPVRPTTDFAKTGLFNILNNLIAYKDVSFLDLFCGTGNITYEFISRGCEHITCVDLDRNCIRFIEDTCSNLNAKGVSVIKEDVFHYLSNSFRIFDVVFADPPFDLEKAVHLPKLVFESNILKENGFFILEHESGKDFSNIPQFQSVRKYGHVSFSFFKSV